MECWSWCGRTRDVLYKDGVGLLVNEQGSKAINGYCTCICGNLEYMHVKFKFPRLRGVVVVIPYTPCDSKSVNEKETLEYARWMVDWLPKS